MDAVPRRLRRDHAGREPQERLRQVAHRRAVEDDLGARRARSRPGRTSIRPGPTARSSSTRPTTTRGRSSSSPRRSSARPRASATTSSRARDDNTLVQGRGRRPGRAGLLRLCLLRGEQGQAPGRGGPERARTPSRCCPARRRSPTRRYAPLSRPLFIYVKNSAARRPEVAEFLKYLPREHRRARRQGRLRSSRRPRTRRPTRRRSPSCSRGGESRRPDHVPATEVRNSRLVLTLRRQPTSHRPRRRGRSLVGPFSLPGVLGSGRDRRPGPLRGDHGPHHGWDHPGPGRPELRVLLARARSSVPEFLFGTELKPDADPPQVRHRPA